MPDWITRFSSCSARPIRCKHYKKCKKNHINQISIFNALRFKLYLTVSSAILGLSLL